MNEQLSRDFIAHRVYAMVRDELIVTHRESEIWAAIAETSDDELYAFYSRLVKERADELRSRVLLQKHSRNKPQEL